MKLNIPELADCEIYVGAIGDAAGNLYHVILLPGDNDNATHKPQLEWAKRIGGDLPTPFTPTALNELIEKVEKMTIERCAEKLLSIGALGDGDFLAAIRALPNVTLEELL